MKIIWREEVDNEEKMLKLLKNEVKVM